MSEKIYIIKHYKVNLSQKRTLKRKEKKNHSKISVELIISKRMLPKTCFGPSVGKIQRDVY